MSGNIFYTILTGLESGRQVRSTESMWTGQEEELKATEYTVLHYYGEDGEVGCISYYNRSGDRHRIDGPAYINYLNNITKWYIHGTHHTNWDHYYNDAKDYNPDEGTLFLNKIKHWNG